MAMIRDLVCRHLRTSQSDKGYEAVVRDSDGFLDRVGLLQGLRRIRRFRAPITERAEGVIRASQRRFAPARQTRAASRPARAVGALTSFARIRTSVMGAIIPAPRGR